MRFALRLNAEMLICVMYLSAITTYMNQVCHPLLNNMNSAVNYNTNNIPTIVTNKLCTNDHRT